MKQAAGSSAIIRKASLASRLRTMRLKMTATSKRQANTTNVSPVSSSVLESSCQPVDQIAIAASPMKSGTRALATVHAGTLSTLIAGKELTEP
jgi:hypothetical protein